MQIHILHPTHLTVHHTLDLAAVVCMEEVCTAAVATVMEEACMETTCMEEGLDLILEWIPTIPTTRV